MKINLNNAELKISAGYPKQFPSSPLPQIAFSGRSNVGKSSLINSLLSRKSLARVSGSPGKTITVNFYEIDKKLFFVDLPGYGYAKRTLEEKKKWSQLTDGYFTSNPDLDRLSLVVQLIDSRIGPTNDDCDMLDYLTQSELPFVIVLTKCDKLTKTELAQSIENINNDPAAQYAKAIIPYSSKTSLGRDVLWTQITAACKL